MKLGITVSDKITGFTGIVTGTAQYISGCSQALVQPKMSPLASASDFVESRWFDEQRLVDHGIPAVVLDNEATPGSDKPAPRR